MQQVEGALLHEGEGGEHLHRHAPAAREQTWFFVRVARSASTVQKLRTGRGGVYVQASNWCLPTGGTHPAPVKIPGRQPQNYSKTRDANS